LITRAILAPEDVALPVVADFDAAPVTADQGLPLGWSTLGGLDARQIEASFEGGFCGLLQGALASHDDQAASEGEVGFKGIDSEGVQAAVFDSAVAYV
jgi:hypothetical protein